jgi:hypothetical protein
MRKLQHMLPCGRVIFYKEVTIDDVFNNAETRNILIENKSELVKFVSFESAGKNNKTWVKKTYRKFVTLLLDKMVNHLMNSDRIETESGNYWLIGGRRSKKFVNWHSDGNSYGIRLVGIPQTHGIRMNAKRRKELRKRVESGQTFHIES